MRQYIRKADIILFIVLVVTGLAASAALSLSHVSANAGAKVIIESRGELWASYPLADDRVITVPAGSSQEGRTYYDHYNIVAISGGTVSVTEASCKNQVCVKHGPISNAGETIVCLPNRLVVRIENSSGEGGGYDSVTS